jgi:hypothetical protein
LPRLVADLLPRKLALIVGNTPAALGAKAATTTVTIIFATAGDPFRDGLLASLNRPSGNVTGISLITAELGAKQLGLLRELRPKATHIGVLVDPNFPAEGFVSGGPNCGFGDGANRNPLRQPRPRRWKLPLQPSSNMGLARCTPVVSGSCTPTGNEFVALATQHRFPRSIAGAKSSLPAA